MITKRMEGVSETAVERKTGICERTIYALRVTHNEVLKLGREEARALSAERRRGEEKQHQREMDEAIAEQVQVLRRFAGAYVIDFRNLEVDEIRAALIKTTPQYFHRDNVEKACTPTYPGLWPSRKPGPRKAIS